MNIREIAESTGYSKSAVSLALRGSSRVSEAARQRILEAAKAMGYRPSPHMRQLMTEIRRSPAARKTLRVAFFNNWDHPFLSGPEEPLRGFFEGARDTALALGYEWREVMTRESSEQTALLDRRLSFENLDGGLVFPSKSSTFFPIFQSFQAPLVDVGLITASARMQVLADHYGNTGVAISRLVEVGCRRIGMALGSQMLAGKSFRFVGAFSSIMRDFGLPLLKPLNLAHPTGESDAIADYVVRNDFDGLIIGPRFDVPAIHQRLLSYGRKNVRIVGCAGSYADHNEAGVPGIEEGWARIGSLGMHHLSRIIENPAGALIEQGELILVPGKWSNGRGALKLPARRSESSGGGRPRE